MATIAPKDLMLDGLKKFFDNNCIFESSKGVDKWQAELEGDIESFDNIFRIAIKHKLVNMDGAFHLIVYLMQAPNVISDLLETRYSPKFDAKKAVETICQIYDLGIKDIIGDTLENDDESDDES